VLQVRCFCAAADLTVVAQDPQAEEEVGLPARRERLLEAAWTEMAYGDSGESAPSSIPYQVISRSYLVPPWALVVPSSLARCFVRVWRDVVTWWALVRTRGLRWTVWSGYIILSDTIRVLVVYCDGLMGRALRVKVICHCKSSTISHSEQSVLV
jgi:hypothetical protein